MINKVKKIKNLDKKSKEIICAITVFSMVAMCVILDVSSFGVYAAGKDMNEVPHVIKAGDREIAVIGSYGEGEAVIEEIKKSYGGDESTTEAIVEPALKLERKEISVGERDPEVKSVEATVTDILEQNKGENPIFKVTVKSSMLSKQPISYSTKIIEKSTLEIGKTEVAVEGQMGTSLLKGNRIMTNGEVVEASIFNTEVLKEPVTRVIYKGTKPIESESGKGTGISTGSMMWPIPSSRNIVSGYGGRIGPVFGKEFHMGYDIAGKYGVSIVAADGGTVVEAGYHNSYGYQVVIQHSNGLKTRYAHNSSLKVKVGQKVSKGQLIAHCGSTGDSVASHLHFEVWKNGSHTNPGNYL